MSHDETARWYLIHCKPWEDERALEHLERQNYECYRPVRQIERLRNGQKVLISESLFPRYLFIHLSSVDDNWYPIRSTRGVQQLVTCNQKPVAVRDEIIDGIRLRLGQVQPEPLLKPGERVVITEAPFSQVEAIFVANEGDERVVLLLNILQKDQRLTFPITSVRKVS
jgi:transcriptional antiterminator RfaH